MPNKNTWEKKQANANKSICHPINLFTSNNNASLQIHRRPLEEEQGRGIVAFHLRGGGCGGVRCVWPIYKQPQLFFQMGLFLQIDSGRKKTPWKKSENHSKTTRPPDVNHLKSSMRWAQRGGDLEAEWISSWDEVASILSNERFCQKTDLSR